LSLDATVHFVTAIGAALPELTVTLTGTMFDAIRREREAALLKLVEARCGKVKVGELLVMDGDPRDAILEAAKRIGADLIIMGSHGRRGLSRALLGSVAESIVRRAPCPVLTLRAEPRRRGAAKTERRAARA
jgi:nucleotide-binding universal stress UspA family protein